MNQYRTACGGIINIPQQARYHLVAHPNVAVYLQAAIGKIKLPAVRRKISEEIDLGYTLGRSGVVGTMPLQFEEPTLFALRANRKLPSRVAAEDEFGEETSKMMVLARAIVTEGQYELITAWIGGRAKKEPWDSSIADVGEFHDCLKFWSSTALVYDSAVMGPVFKSSWKDVLFLGKCRFL
jgi:hypothetical protein